ncbi:hypothetical protein HYH03_014095 [Edaphochlamys debaryana]|uniref:Uncharacterized protein n=1 Tax=Edaphochlamys debaryana TaxID=47281 RepID=A0A835XQR7_9CHLO|nr:hypothetical protein HYH03_014095 [Edaphochlamys debaryana]|eukprot:KAG2487253.1 hypothetical protein HYH03_014095 [Edaphochlamys debaryana]
MLYDVAKGATKEAGEQGRLYNLAGSYLDEAAVLAETITQTDAAISALRAAGLTEAWHHLSTAVEAVRSARLAPKQFAVAVPWSAATAALKAATETAADAMYAYVEAEVKAIAAAAALAAAALAAPF